jgi:uncharacterized repeat protein (TIGR03803 family)
VTGPNSLNLVLTSSQTITGTEGTYTVTAKGVAVGSSVYYATVPSQSLTIAAGASSQITVDYYTIVPNTTKALDIMGKQTLTISSDGSTLTISSSSEVAASLQPGDVLVSSPCASAPHGLLRKVSTVTQSGSNIVITTASATLADEVTRVRFNVTVPIAPSSESASARRLRARYGKAPSVMPHGYSSTLPNPCAGAADEYTIPLNVALPPDPSGNTIGSTGELDFCSLNLALNFDSVALSGSLQATTNLYSHVVVQGRYSVSVDQRIDLDPEELEDQVVCLGNQTCTSVAGLPDSIADAIAVITPVVTPFVGVSGNAAVGFYTGKTIEGQLEAGMTFSSAGATPTFTQELQGAADPTSLDGNLDLKAYAGVELGAELFGSLTFHVDPDGFVQFDANTGANPWWTLDAGAEADAGVTASLLGFFSQDFDTPEFQITSMQIAEASGSFSGQAVIATMTPNTATVGSPNQTLVLTGSNFVPGCFVSFNGTALPTTFTDPDDLTATLPGSLLVLDGVFPITVTNPDVNGAPSSPANLAVTGALVSVSPSTAQVPATGLQQFSATVLGPSNTAVTWSVNGLGGGNSTVGTISAAGLYTAPTTVPNPATVTVTATSQALPSASSSASLTIGPYTEKPLYSFTSLTDGAAPSAPLIQGSDGYYYGTAQFGGSNGYGTVFKVDSSGNITPLHEFSGSDGAGPVASLVQASDGNFYGTTQGGGAHNEGAIFKIDLSGNFTTAYSFTGGDDGGDVISGLIEAQDGYLYGATFNGGASDAGVVFRTDTSGNTTTLYSFSGGTDGFGPEGNLIQATDGDFYGVTQNGGDLSCGIFDGPGTGCGTVYRIDSGGNLTTLYSFTGASDGANPFEALMQGSDGYFYGTTVFGGDSSCTVSHYTGCGTIFKIDSVGNLTAMHEFSGGVEGGVPVGPLIQSSDGDFYGTATAGGDPSCSVTASGEDYPTYTGCGTVFKMDSAGNVNALYSFTGSPNDGSNPFSSLLQGSDGYFYGTTRWGGTDSSCKYTNNGGCGTIFWVSGPGGPGPQGPATITKARGQRLQASPPRATHKEPVPKALHSGTRPRGLSIKGAKPPADVH